MKSKRTILNSFFGMFTNIVAIIIGLIAQSIFIRILGIEYLGINGLFINIISFLSIVESGIGNAIIFNLYRPIVNKDVKTVRMLMTFYKKCYRIVAIIVMSIGLLICPFIDFFVNDVSANVNLYFVFLLILFDTTCSYLLSYKRSILYANQENYYLNIVHIGYLILMNFFQLLFLYFTRNYYVYLIIKIVFRILENLIITFIANKKYYDFCVPGEKLTSDLRKDIVKKVKSLFFHKIGSFVVLGTDNILISKFVGITAVGLYSNYYLITDSVKKIFSQIIVAATSSVGHMLVNNNHNHNYLVFKRIRLINFWLSIFTSICILVLCQDFITVWIGNNYLLDKFTLIVIVINFFFAIMKYSYITFKDAAGIYYEDRYIPLVESLVNLVLSIAFIKIFGLPGVFIGTICSTMILYFYSYPKYVYVRLFKQDIKKYFVDLFVQIVVFTFFVVTSIYFSNFISLNNIYLQIIAKLIFCIVYINLILILIYRKSDEFYYVISLMRNCISKFKHRREK